MNRIRKKDSLSPVAIALHTILLDECNSNDWESFRMKNGLLESLLGVKFRSLSAAREQLQISGLIKFKTKNGSEECSYQILAPEECKEHLTFALNAKVSVEVDDKVSDEVGAEVGEKVDDVYISREFINRNGNKNRNEESASKSHSKNSSRKKSSEPEKEKTSAQKEKTTYSECMEVYHDWFLKRYEIGPKIDGLQGKSMKEIIGYLTAQLKKQHGEDIPEQELTEKIKKAWEWILSNWDKLDAFTKEKTKLNQINSEIQNIIIKIKKPVGNETGTSKGNDFGESITEAQRIIREHFNGN